MLVLSRKTNEQIQIGTQIIVTILQVKGRSVRVGIEAPRDVRIVRTEILAKALRAAGKPSGAEPGAAARVDAGGARPAGLCHPAGSSDAACRFHSAAADRGPVDRQPGGLVRHSGGLVPGAARRAGVASSGQRLGPATLAALAARR